MTTDTNQNEIRKEYELAFLLTNQEAMATVLTVLKKHSITPSYQGQLNRLRLAYPIRKQGAAFFAFLYFETPPETILKLKSDLSLEPSIIRFLIVTSPPKSPLRERRPNVRTPESKPAADMPRILSNEALEQKLEEILK